MSTSEDAERRDERMRTRPGRPTLGAIAWLAILVVISIVQVARKQWIDALIFAVAVVLLGAEALGLLRRLAALPRPTLPIAVSVGAAAAVGLVLVPRHSPAAGLVMIAIAVAAALSTWPQPAGAEKPTPWPHALRMLGWWWAIVGIVACVWEIVQVTVGGLVVNGRETHPALSDLLNPLLDDPVGKVLFVALWVAFGVFLVRRGVRR
jgi:hypothetical protein